MLFPTSRPLIAFYGDDFTGSTDVLEALAFAGLPTVLFLRLPSTQEMQRFAGYAGIGLAGIARSQSPTWMDRELPGIFSWLKEIGAPILHYKVCSTFDSSPTIGSIGRAIELALATTGAAWASVVVGLPSRGRYQAFGTLFASAGGAVHRIDRHPVMAHHPVTPMREADLARHLAIQTQQAIALVDLAVLKAGDGAERLKALVAGGARIVLIDVIDEETLAIAGALVAGTRGRPHLSASSSALEHALIAHWRSTGALPPAPAPARIGPVDRLLVLSGSCSPVTAGQIAYAQRHGFSLVPADCIALTDPETRPVEIKRLVEAAASALAEGRDVLVYSARGPDDPQIAHLAAACRTAGRPEHEAQAMIGDALGAVLVRVLERQPLARIALAGGDTSGRIMTALGALALEAIAPLAPGSPLCRLHSPTHDGLELTLKGGQVGEDDFFLAAAGRTGNLAQVRPLV